MLFILCKMIKMVYVENKKSEPNIRMYDRVEGDDERNAIMFLN